MGQKTNPISLRLRINRKQDSSWFADYKYTKTLVTEIRIRKYLERLFKFSRLPTSRIIVQLLPKKIKLYPFFKRYKFIRKKTASRKSNPLRSFKKRILYEYKQKRKEILKLEHTKNFESIRLDSKNDSSARRVGYDQQQKPHRGEIEPRKGGTKKEKKKPADFFNIPKKKINSTVDSHQVGANKETKKELKKAGQKKNALKTKKSVLYTTVFDITKFLKKRKEKLKELRRSKQEYTKNLKRYYISKEYSRKDVSAKAKHALKRLKIIKKVYISKSFIKKLVLYKKTNIQSSNTQSILKLKFQRNENIQLKKKIEERKQILRIKNHNAQKKIKFYKYHKRLFKLSSSGLFLRKKKLRACPYGLDSTLWSRALRKTVNCFKISLRKKVIKSHQEWCQPARLARKKKKESSVQDLLFLKYLLKLNITEKNAIQNSFFSFFSLKKDFTHYLSTNSIENVESILYKTLKCNTSVLPLKIRNPLKSAYFLALFIGNGLKKKKSLRQIFRLITKFKKKSETYPYLKKKKKHPKHTTIKGIRILCSGRINGVEKAKTQSKRLGQTSLHFFSEKIDYSCIHINTKFGIIGVKVWICFKKNNKRRKNRHEI